LLPASALPPGFTLVGSRDDGNTLPYDLPQQVSAGQACQLLEKSAWIRVSGLEPFAYVQGVYSNAGHTGIGDEAISGVQSAPELYGGSTLVAVRVGSVIITLTVSSSGSDRGAAAVDYATGIAKNIAAAHLG
jgi:hypothetical protein